MSGNSGRKLRSHSKMGSSLKEKPSLRHVVLESSSESENGFGKKLDSWDESSIGDFVVADDEIEKEHSSMEEDLLDAKAAKRVSKKKKPKAKKHFKKIDVAENAERANVDFSGDNRNIMEVDKTTISKKLFPSSVAQKTKMMPKDSMDAEEAQPSTSAHDTIDVSNVPDQHPAPYWDDDGLVLPPGIERIPNYKYSPYCIFYLCFPRMPLYRENYKLFNAELKRIRELWNKMSEDEMAPYLKASEELAEIWEEESPRSKKNKK